MFITKAWAATTEAAQNTAAQNTGAAHAKEVFPPFDPASFASQILWLAITFGVFYFIMGRVIIPRIASILEVRRDRISRDLDEANRLKDEADAAIAAYEQELAEARLRAQIIGQDARDTAKAQAEAKRHAVDVELNNKLAEAEARINAIRDKALGEVANIALDTTAAIVKQLLGENVSNADISKVIATFGK